MQNRARTRAREEHTRACGGRLLQLGAEDAGAQRDLQGRGSDRETEHFKNYVHRTASFSCVFGDVFGHLRFSATTRKCK